MCIRDRHNTEKLPQVPKDTKNKLVSVGSTKASPKDHTVTKIAASKTIKNLYKDSITLEAFKSLLEDAKQANDYDKVQAFYSTTFKTALGLCSAFKQRPRQDGARLENPELRMDFMYAVMDAIKAQPIGIQKAVIRAVVQCLLEESTLLLSKDHARSLFILLQNPLFTSQVRNYFDEDNNINV